MRKAIGGFMALLMCLMVYFTSYATDTPLSVTQTLVMASEIDSDNRFLLTALAEKESSLRPYVSNGECIGLCQVNPKYWQAEISRLNITDLYDARQNMTLANEILNSTDYPLELKLMLYNMKRTTAFTLWQQNKVTDYAISIIERAEELQRLDFIQTVNAIAIESDSNQLMVMNEDSYELCKPLDIRVLVDNELDLYEWELFEK